MTDILAALAAPFPPDMIDWRVGPTTKDKAKGMALAYIDARAVQDRLTQVCGAHWQCEHVVSTDGKKVMCRIGVKIGEEWIWRSDGAGETDMEADKGAFSDAFKRAAVKWGIGRHLYDTDSPWVELEDNGRKIAAAALARLQKKPAPSAPTVKTEPPKPGEFWSRANLELKSAKIKNLLDFASAFEEACRKAPNIDLLLKLEQDNDAHLAALQGQSPSAHKQAKTVHGNEMLKFTQKAA